MQQHQYGRISAVITPVQFITTYYLLILYIFATHFIPFFVSISRVTWNLQYFLLLLIV